MTSLRRRMVALCAASAAVLAIPGTASAAPPSGPSVHSLGDGTSRIVVPMPGTVGIRDAAPLVMSGDRPLGFGRVSADRRSIVLEYKGTVGAASALRVAWSGGGVPTRRDTKRNATRPTAPDRSVRATPQRTLDLPDPGAAGTRQFSRGQYSLGDTALRVPSGAKVDVTGEITYPREPVATRARPVVVLLHGRHSYCGRADGMMDYNWPCKAGYRRIPSEQGYRPLADLLASHGMIVISVAANGINATDENTSDGGARDRGYLVLHHLNLWKKWSTTDVTGPFGTRFRGALDLTNVGLMGHSRGGEGVVAALAENRGQGSKYGIKAVLPLAPVDFTRMNLRGTPSMTLVPYCDGDVSDLQGVHFYDDATAGTVDTVPHALLGVLGANHNFFNTVWTPGGWESGASDDWYNPDDEFCGNNSGRLTPKQQIAAGNAYMAGFFRSRLLGQTGYDALFHGNTATPPSAAPTRTVASWSPPTGERLILNDNRADATNALGGTVQATGFDAALRCGGTGRYENICIAPRGRGTEPHLTRSYFAPQVPGLAQTHLVWSKSGPAWENAIPAQYRNVSGYRTVSIRMSKDVWALSATTPAVGLRLRDTAGKESTIRLAGHALDTPVFTKPGGGDPYGSSVPHALVATVPVALSSFAGVDLTNVQDVSLVTLGSSGDITVGDVSFQK